VFVNLFVTDFGKLGPAVQPTALFVEKSEHLGAYPSHLITHSCMI
jgi:hypothetical protein